MYQGCYQDGDENDRVMDVLVKRGASVSECRNFCQIIDHPYAAIQNGEYCFCGKSMQGMVTSTNCNSPCFDSSDQFCGGNQANSIYMSGAPLASEALFFDAFLLLDIFEYLRVF